MAQPSRENPSAPPGDAPSDDRHVAAGIALVVLAGTMLASMDALGKHLSVRLDVLQVVWARYAVQTVGVFAWLALRTGQLRFLRSRRPLTQTVRAAALLGVTISLYTALTYVPLADATAVMFFAPVLVTLLAGVFLGERVGPHRIAAVVVGFIGVLLVVRPGLSMDWAMLLPLVAALMLTLYLLVTRYISAHDHRHATVFYSTAVGALALSCVVPWHWQPPTALEWGLMLAMGCLGALGHVSIVVGFARAPASVLSPFLYSQLLAASALSVMVFGDPLAPLTIAGALLLVGGGLLIWLVESIGLRRSVPPAARRG